MSSSRKVKSPIGTKLNCKGWHQEAAYRMIQNNLDPNNAEDPDNKFRPSPGKITSFHMPGGMGIRVDTHVYAGYDIPPNYDSMIAKLIVHAPSRIEAINRMIGALDECVIEGIKTIIPFQKQILADANFKRGDFNTGFLDEFYYKSGEQN